MKYTDYKWEEVFIAGTLKNLFLEKHQLRNKKMKKNEKLALISTCLAKAQLDKATCQQPARKVNVEENVDFHNGDEEQRVDDNDGDYDSVHADDTDDDSNGCDNKEYDGSNKDQDVVLQEIGSSSEDDDDKEATYRIEDEFCSRVGRSVTTFRSRRFFWRF